MGTRVTNEVVFLEHRFTQEERNEKSLELAQAYNQKQAVDGKEKVAKSQFAEARAHIDAKVVTLSRDLTVGFEVRETKCELVYDSPNVGEVSYHRSDDGLLVKTRAMTDDERQMELPLGDVEGALDSIMSATAADEAATKSAKNIETFFKEPVPEPTSHPEPPADWQGSQEEYEEMLRKKEGPQPPKPPEKEKDKGKKKKD